MPRRLPSCLAAAAPRCSAPACRAAVRARCSGPGQPSVGSTPDIRRATRGVAAVFYWLAKFVFLGPLLRVLWRPWVEGLENIPDDRPGDPGQQPPVVLRLVLHAGAGAAQGDLPGQGRVLHHARASRAFFSADVHLRRRQVPIDRDDADAARAALNTGVRVLRRGHAAGHLPRGHPLAGRPALPRQDRRRPDGAGVRRRRHPVRDGQHRRSSSRPGGCIPKLRPRPGVRFGKPLDFSRYEGMAGDRFVERSMTDEIMYELMQLSGQEYVDKYAAKVKKAEGDGRRRSAAASARSRDVRELGDRVPDTRASYARCASSTTASSSRTAARSSWSRSASSTRPAASSTPCPPSSTRRRAIDWVRRNVLDKLPARPTRPGARSSGSATTCSRS